VLAVLRDLRKCVEKIASRSRETIKARHRQNVAGGELSDHTAQLGAISGRPTRRLAKNAFRA
jgi:hypothetical protein